MLFFPIAALGLSAGHLLATFGAFPTVAVPRQTGIAALFASQSIFINNGLRSAVLLVMIVSLLSLSFTLCCTYRTEPAPGLKLSATITTCNVPLRYQLNLTIIATQASKKGE